ncbi:MAG: Omp28-related outer membrane protein [Saprospiraceae bacterium]
MKRLSILLGFGLLISCEEIPINIHDVIIEPTEKIVLIEELTGAKCPNCPKGTKVVENILHKYPKNVIAVGIHGSFLAEPVRSGDPDLRNEDAKNLENWFKPWFGKPSASVNRIVENIEYYVNDVPDLWESLVEDELEKPLQLNLFMDVKFDQNSRKIDIEVAVNPLDDLTGDYNISIYVLESHIITAQANGSEIIEEYEHNHVLRKTVTNFSGDFFGNNLSKNQILKKNYSYILPAEEGKLNIAENSSIVAFIHKSGSSVRDVIQATSKYLIE